MILQRVSPVTHSIGNCLKRVIVIVASVIFFQNPMSQQNMLGALLQMHVTPGEHEGPSELYLLPAISAVSIC
jgi:hypothetical protein